MKVVLAGGSGALGRAIATDLTSQGHSVVILTRTPRENSPHRQVHWDGTRQGEWSGELADAAVINLAGELVDRRPNTRSIALLKSSRVQPTLALAEAAEAVGSTTIWIQMSTLAIYGDRGDEVLTEGSAVGCDPPQMVDVAKAWEAAATSAEAHVRRQVTLRTGIVLQRNTPALDRLTSLVRWGLGGRVGSGRQWVSWIHVADFLSAVRFALVEPGLAGIVHVTSPQPVQNAELMHTLRTLMHRPLALPNPEFLVKVGARFLLRTDPALALTGRRCKPARLQRHEFAFEHPELRSALPDLLSLRGPHM